MKKIISLLALLLIAFSAYAQVFYNGNKLGTSRLQGNKVGNLFVASVTASLAPANTSKVVEGETAETVITESKPVFIVRFESKRDSVFANSENIDAIVLMKLHVKKNSRRLRTGKFGIAAGVQTGVAQKDLIPISIEEDENEDRVFIVKPKIELEKGEYAFYFVGKDIRLSKVYDFAIKRND